PVRSLVFFSSRRRHTRWPRDWSSDVCSSDLPGEPICHLAVVQSTVNHGRISRLDPTAAEAMTGVLAVLTPANAPRLGDGLASDQIGRASCRERVQYAGGAGSVKGRAYMRRLC